MRVHHLRVHHCHNKLASVLQHTGGVLHDVRERMSLELHPVHFRQVVPTVYDLWQSLVYHRKSADNPTRDLDMEIIHQ